MSNPCPFKKGDKLICTDKVDLGSRHAFGQLVTVKEVNPQLGHPICAEPYVNGDTPRVGNHWTHYRAAIAGQDYPMTATAVREGMEAYYAGHLADGSSVQAHSAGPLYPVVLVWRDKQLAGDGKYDVGIISPRNSEPIWMSSFDAAVGVAELIKENIK